MRALIFGLIILISGCNAFQDEQLVPEQLQGEWSWYRTAGGWGTYIDADSVNYSMTLRIYAQNKAEWFRNDTLVQSYDIVEGQDEWTKGDLVLFRQNRNEDIVDCGYIIDGYTGANELHLRTALCTDSPTHYFSRE